MTSGGAEIGHACQFEKCGRGDTKRGAWPPEYRYVDGWWCPEHFAVVAEAHNVQETNHGV